MLSACPVPTSSKTVTACGSATATNIEYIKDNERHDNGKLNVTFEIVNYHTNETRNLFVGSIAHALTAMAHQQSNTYNRSWFENNWDQNGGKNCGHREWGPCEGDRDSSLFSVGPGEVQVILSEESEKTNGGISFENMLASFDLIEPLSGIDKFGCSEMSAVFAGLNALTAMMLPEFGWISSALSAALAAGKFGTLGREGLSVSCEVNSHVQVPPST